MHKKRLALSQILMILVAVVVFAIFSASTVYAYNANLRMKLPVDFTATACTITFKAGNSSAQQVYHDGTLSSLASPVARNTLQVSYTCPQSPVSVYVFQVTNGTNKIQVTAINAYGENVALNNADLVTISNNTSATVTVTLNSGVTLASGDVLKFNILIS